jgi:hypothetical protein
MLVSGYRDTIQRRAHTEGAPAACETPKIDLGRSPSLAQLGIVIIDHDHLARHVDHGGRQVSKQTATAVGRWDYPEKL